MSLLLFLAAWLGTGGLTAAALANHTTMGKPETTKAKILYGLITAAGPIAASIALLLVFDPEVGPRRLKYTERRLLLGPKADDDLPKCLAIKAAIMKEKAKLKVLREMRMDIVSRVQNALDNDFHSVTSGKPIDAHSIAATDAAGLEDTCQELLRAEERLKLLEQAEEVTDDLIAAHRFALEGTLEASGLAQLLALPGSALDDPYAKLEAEFGDKPAESDEGLMSETGGEVANEPGPEWHDCGPPDESAKFQEPEEGLQTARQFDRADTEPDDLLLLLFLDEDEDPEEDSLEPEPPEEATDEHNDPETIALIGLPTGQRMATRVRTQTLPGDELTFGNRHRKMRFRNLMSLGIYLQDGRVSPERWACIRGHAASWIMTQFDDLQLANAIADTKDPKTVGRLIRFRLLQAAEYLSDD